MVGFKSLTGAGVRASDLGQRLSVYDSLTRDRKLAARLLKIEVGQSDRQHRIVVFDVNVRLSGVQHSARRQRHVNRIRESEDRAGTVQGYVTGTRRSRRVSWGGGRRDTADEQ